MFSQDATPGTVPRFLTAAATIATLGAAVLSLSLGVWLCGSGFEHIRGADAAVILTVQKALLGTPILTDPADRPYATTQYSPLIYVIDFGLAKAMGVQADELVRLSGICRGVSLAALLLLVATLTFGLRRFLGVGWAMAATMGGYSFVVFSPWGYVARPDSLQSLFTALTVLIVATAADRSETEGLWLFCLAGITSIASLYSKQNGIQAAAVLFGFLLLHRWWRAMFWSAATMLATVVALWIAAPPIVGSAWRQNLIGGIDNGTNLTNFVFVTYQMVASFHALPLVSAILVVSFGARYRRHLRRSEIVLLLALVFSFAWATLTAQKVGSAENYYNDFLILQAVVCAYGLASRRLPVLGELCSRSAALYILCLYLIVFIPAKAIQQASLYFVPYYHAARVSGPGGSDAGHFIHYSDVAAFLQQRIHEEPAYFSSQIMAVCNLLPVSCVVGDPDVSFLSYQRHPRNWAKYKEDVRTGRIRYFVLRPGQRPPSLLGVSLADARVLMDSPKAMILELTPPGDGRR